MEPNFLPADATNPTRLQSAIEDATPDYSSKVISKEAPIIQNPDGTLVPRVTESEGILGGERTVNPDESDISAGTALANLKTYDPGATNLENLNNAAIENIGKARALQTALDNEGIVRPPKEVYAGVRTAVEDAADKSVLLQKTDAAVVNYLRTAQRLIEQNKGDLGGEMMVRKGLDSAYEDAGGKYANNKPLDQIHAAARNFLNKDIADHAQTTEVKASLEEQTNLYRAMDVLRDKAISEGENNWERFVKRNPKLAQMGEEGMGLLGLGGVLRIFKP